MRHVSQHCFLWVQKKICGSVWAIAGLFGAMQPLITDRHRETFCPKDIFFAVEPGKKR